MSTSSYRCTASFGDDEGLVRLADLDAGPAELVGSEQAVAVGQLGPDLGRPGLLVHLGSDPGDLARVGRLLARRGRARDGEGRPPGRLGPARMSRSKTSIQSQNVEVSATV